MHEIDLIQAVSIWINLSYTAAQWWITVTTALVVATYFAAKHIPPWFFGLILLLYILTATSAAFESAWYASFSASYGARLEQVRAAVHDIPNDIRPSASLAIVNRFANYAVFAVGTFCAAGFSFLHWRVARRAASN